MKPALCSAALAATLAWSAAAPAADLRITNVDTIESVLRAQKARVTVRLRSGQELTGAVRSVDSRLLHLGSLTGREFFDAVVPLEAIEAVIVRTKE
jgi:hypothetical protein